MSVVAEVAAGPAVSAEPAVGARVSADVSVQPAAGAAPAVNEEASVALSATAIAGQCDEIAFESSNLLRLDNAQDEGVEPPTDIDGASVEATLTDVTDPDNPAAIIGPIAMPEFPAPAANDYRASFLADAGSGFFVGQRVQILYDFDGGAGLVRQFNIIALVCE